MSHTVLKISNDSYKYKNLVTIVNVMLTYSWIKLLDVPLCTLYMVVCIKTSSVEVYDPKGLSPCAVY